MVRNVRRSLRCRRMLYSRTAESARSDRLCRTLGLRRKGAFAPTSMSHQVGGGCNPHILRVSRGYDIYSQLIRTPRMSSHPSHGTMSTICMYSIIDSHCSHNIHGGTLSHVIDLNNNNNNNSPPFKAPKETFQYDLFQFVLEKFHSNFLKT